MTSPRIDLAQLFQAVTGSLSQQKDTLNQSDTYNHDHGDHMVEIFQVITQAMQEKQGAPPAEQLEYAAQLLHQQSSGSAQVYSQGLQQAAQIFQGQSAITPDNAMQLVQSLLGGQTSTASPQQPQQSAGGMLGSLLSGLTGGGQQDGQGAGLDAGDLINAGMAFMNAKQGGQNNMEALVSAAMNASPLAQTPHRSQSGQVVASTLLNTIMGMMGK